MSVQLIEDDSVPIQTSPTDLSYLYSGQENNAMPEV